MSGALMNKVWDLFGMDSAEPEGYEDENIYDYDNNEEEETEEDVDVSEYETIDYEKLAQRAKKNE